MSSFPTRCLSLSLSLSPLFFSLYASLSLHISYALLLACIFSKHHSKHVSPASILVSGSQCDPRPPRLTILHLILDGISESLLRNQNMVLIGEMLIMLIMLNPYSRKRIFLAGEMLIMLIMLNQNGDSWGDLQIGFNIINIINTSAARSKKCFRQGKC